MHYFVFCTHLEEEERAGCFALIVLRMSCDLVFCCAPSTTYHRHNILKRDRRQSKTLLTINECGSTIASNSVIDCHLSNQATNGNRNLFLTFFYLVDSISVFDCRPIRCGSRSQVLLQMHVKMAQASPLQYYCKS